MLLILTGDVQSGKTRWLERLVAELATEGVESRGVLAPGAWRPRPAGGGGPRPLGSGEGAYEKLGIDNVLLPQGERLRFARRRDLAERDGQLNPASQSAAARLAWEISEEALARVNAHLETLADGLSGTAAGVPCETPVRKEGGAGADAPAAGEAVAGARPWLLVVDELGRLELEGGGGLTAALSLLDRGPTGACPHALVVVRARLRGRAEERFAAAWGGAAALVPGDEARATVRRALGLASLIDNEYH